MRGLKKIISNKALGEKSSTNIKVGDLVEFHQLSEKKQVLIEKFQGIIIEFYKEHATGRAVCMARVLPINSSLIVEVPCATIKKLETN